MDTPVHALWGGRKENETLENQKDLAVLTKTHKSC